MEILDFIIIGQGIAGTILANELIAADKSIKIINCSNGNPASLTAGAVLNPNKIWSTKVQAPSDFATFETVIQYYRQIEIKINTKFLFAKPLLLLDEHINSNLPNINFGISQSYHNTYFLDSNHFLKAQKRYFESKGIYHEGLFQEADMEYKNDIFHWNGYKAKAIMYCEGAKARNNPRFTQFAFTKNQGDALILSIPNLTEDYILQIGDARLLPLGNHHFWWGTQHKWDFEEAKPDEDWKTTQIERLQKAIPIPFEVIAHMAAERPTTPGQKIILHFDPEQNIGIVNGLGSKGYTQSVLQIPDFVQKFLL